MTWKPNLFRIIVSACVLLMAIGCGLNDDDRDEENKNSYISIPDKAFERVCLAACDLDGNQRISRYEAQRVVTLSCPDAEIEFVTGIAEFTNLRSFNCAGNRIATLDLHNNIALRLLDCSNNQISSLDIRGLRQLTELRCADNLLLSLNLSDNSLLSTIVCNGNRLVTLDVSFCATQIALLDARYNPSLTTLYVASSQRVERQLLDAQTSVIIR